MKTAEMGMGCACLEAVARVELGAWPTPVERLPRLEAELGLGRLLVKRDDLTGLALGGNKTRKLEYLVAEARAGGADTLITTGAAQSNHCRQTAAAAARVGMRCELVVNGDRGQPVTGNLLLDRLCGATVHWCAREDRAARMEAVAAAVRARGGAPYVIPLGGSTGLGALGYVRGASEALRQLAARGEEVDTMVCASSSGGTQAGLVLGAALAGYRGRIVGISIDAPEQSGYEEQMAAVARDAAARLGVSAPGAEAFTVAYDYLGGGYGVLGALEREAIDRAARCEGLLLDPVYTGRAFGAMLDMARGGGLAPGERVLFWHTGGTPALFAYAGGLVKAGE